MYLRALMHSPVRKSDQLVEFLLGVENTDGRVARRAHDLAEGKLLNGGKISCV